MNFPENSIIEKGADSTVVTIGVFCYNFFRMRIGIDTFGCDHARSGIGTYLLSFASNLPEESDIEIEFFGAEIDRYTYTSGKDIGFESVQLPESLNALRLWHFTNINKFASQRHYDAIIYPAPDRVLPISFNVPGIAVVNSILSGKVEGNRDWIQKLQIKRGLFKVPKIIAASNFIKSDLVRHGVGEEKIDVVHNGIDHKLFFPSVEFESDTVSIKPFAIKKPYFIYCSKISGPAKKHVELIRAFSSFKEKTGFPHRLVLAGSDGSYAAEVHKAALDSPCASDIFLTGYFPHESLPKLYSGAVACIFPSVKEGVGLPVLEAMACGVPVLCSKASALPEIGGESALYFDSDDIEGMAKCMEKIVSDSELRNRMSIAGQEWARAFDWRFTVKNTLDLIREMIKKD